MRRYPIIIGWMLALALLVPGCVRRAEQSPLQDAGQTTVASLNAPELQDGQSAGERRPASAADDATIARVTALMLTQEHYLKQPLDDTISTRHLEHYLDALDPLHLYFLQSDLQEFEPWQHTLDDQLQQSGDTSAANKIFTRFLQRLDQQGEYVNRLLKADESFTFTGDDAYVLDRKNLPRPKDLAEAQQIWRERLRYEYLQEKLNKQKPEEIVKTLTRRYARLARTMHDYDNDDIFQLYLSSLTHAYDPHSDYLGRASLENFGIQMKLSLVGIGAKLQSEDGYCKVVELIPGGPAIRSKKMKEGDRIVAVAQGDEAPVDVVDMKLDRIVDMIRGPKGTTVRLTLLPAGATDPSTRKTITLVRDEIKLEEQEAKAKLIAVPQSGGKTLRLGVIDLPSFYADMDSRTKSHKSTTADVARLLKKLEAEKVGGVILDLRRNGGGSLPEAIALTGLFIKKGPVVQVKDSDGTVRVDDDPDPTVLYDGPLIVLTSRLSASASEILAGALQDYGRALIIGDSSTFGKGTVQAVMPLGPILQRNHIKIATDPGALMLTIQKFYRASGASTQLKGVIPDLTLPSLTNYIDVGEKTLENPLKWDTIPSARFQKLNRVQPYLASLRKRSEARIATDKDFAYQQQQITQLKEMLAKKSVSLNEQQRLKEKQETDARVAARKKELASRPASKEKEYLITLKQAALPGLPPPIPANSAKNTTTNQKPSSAEDEDSDTLSPEEGTTAQDITLTETRRILADLIALSKISKKPVTAAR